MSGGKHTQKKKSKVGDEYMSTHIHTLSYSFVGIHDKLQGGKGSCKNA